MKNQSKVNRLMALGQVYDDKVKSSSLYPSGIQNPRKKISEAEYKKKKAKRKNKKNRR
tara:strand:- start:15013 stop:15186 length:174 start_codon:yes stop_codon:yes gene_type:complete